MHVDHSMEAGPCRGCEHAERCGLMSLACEAFGSFVVAGGSDRWKLKPRRPSRAEFERLFPELREKGAAPRVGGPVVLPAPIR